ncbi:MAG: hypothetical protein SNJ71_00145 [Bacteroidales bacterium]
MSDTIDMIMNLQGNMVERLGAIDNRLTSIYRDMQNIDRVSNRALRLRNLNDTKNMLQNVQNGTVGAVKSLEYLRSQLARMEQGAARAWRTDHIERYRRMIESTRAEIARVEQLHGKGSNTATLHTRNMAGLPWGKLGVAGLAFTALSGTKEFVVDSLNTRAKYEKYEALLSNTLGSRSLGLDSMNQISIFASVTPFQVEELTGAYVKLVNRGFKPSIEQMRNLGDVASSTGKSFDQLVEAMLDAETGEFERMKEFGIKAKQEGDKVTLTFKGQSVTIQNTAENIRNYVLGLGKTAGVQGSMAKISKTLGGQLSNLQDNWDALLNSMGKSSGGVFSTGISVISSLIQGVKAMVEESNPKQIIGEKNEINTLVGTITSLNEGNETRLRLLNQLKEKYPELLGNLDIEKLKNEDLLTTLDKVNKAYSARFSTAVKQDITDKQAAELEKLKKRRDELMYLQSVNTRKQELFNIYYNKDISKRRRLTAEEIAELSKLTKIQNEYAFTNFFTIDINKSIAKLDAEIAEKQAILDNMNNDLKQLRQKEIIERALAVNTNDSEVMRILFKDDENIKKMFLSKLSNISSLKDADYDILSQILEGTYNLPKKSTSQSLATTVNDMTTAVSTGGKQVKQIYVNMEALIKGVTNNFSSEMNQTDSMIFDEKLKQALLRVLNDTQQML